MPKNTTATILGGPGPTERITPDQAKVKQPYYHILRVLDTGYLALLVSAAHRAADDTEFSADIRTRYPPLEIEPGLVMYPSAARMIPVNDLGYPELPPEPTNEEKQQRADKIAEQLNKAIMGCTCKPGAKRKCKACRAPHVPNLIKVKAI